MLACLGPALARAGDCRIVLVPGAFGAGKSGIFLDGKEYFAEAERFFREKGCATTRIEFPENATIELRARVLRDQVLRFVKEQGGGKAVLLAHSQGGLDARFALKSLALRSVSALITIGTPHHGTPLADFVLRHRKEESPLYWVLRIFGNYDLNALPFAGEMTEAFLKQNASYFEPVAGVRYASARGVCLDNCHWSLRLLSWLSGHQGGLGTAEGGDGIVPSDAQAFGDELGSYDLDHISEVSASEEGRTERLRFLRKAWDYRRFEASK